MRQRACVLPLSSNERPLIPACTRSNVPFVAGAPGSPPSLFRSSARPAPHWAANIEPSTLTAVPLRQTCVALADQPGLASGPVSVGSGAVQGNPEGGSQSL